MADPGEVPTAALEDVAYLSRSENRVRILAALTTRAYPRRELAAVTDTSRTTLGRILSEFEERGWAERTTDGEYVATPRGEHAAAEFMPLVKSMAALRHLGEAAAWIPTDELDIGLHHFRDATVSRTAPNEPVGLNRHLAELIEESSTLSTLTFIAPPVLVGRAMYEGVESGRLTAEHVLAGGLVAHLRDNPDGPPPWREYVAGGARVYRYDGHIPCNLFVTDQVVLLMNDRPTGGESIESENDAIRSWADELIEAYREDADPVDAETFE